MENFNANEWFIENDKSTEKIVYEFEDNKINVKLKTMKRVYIVVNAVLLLSSIIALSVMIFGYGYYYGLIFFISVIGILVTAFINLMITVLVKEHVFFITSIISSFMLFVILVLFMLLNIF